MRFKGENRAKLGTRGEGAKGGAGEAKNARKVQDQRNAATGLPLVYEIFFASPHPPTIQADAATTAIMDDIVVVADTCSGRTIFSNPPPPNFGYFRGSLASYDIPPLKYRLREKERGGKETWGRG